MYRNRISDFSMPDGGPWGRPALPGGPNSAASEQHPAITPDLYAMAWTQSIRDHEIDKLFNSPPDYEI